MTFSIPQKFRNKWGTKIKGSSQPCKLLTNFMESSRSWEATSCAAIQKHTSILWNQKFHYLIHMRPPLVPTLSQINPVHTILSYLSKTNFNIINPFTCSYSQWFYPLTSLLISSIHSTYPHSCYVPCQFRLPSLNHSNYTCRRTQNTKPYILQFCQLFDCLCGLVVRVPGYRPRGPGLIPCATRYSEK
jgi:hypothetical protein